MSTNLSSFKNNFSSYFFWSRFPNKKFIEHTFCPAFRWVERCIQNDMWAGLDRTSKTACVFIEKNMFKMLLSSRISHTLSEHQTARQANDKPAENSRGKLFVGSSVIFPSTWHIYVLPPFIWQLNLLSLFNCHLCRRSSSSSYGVSAYVTSRISMWQLDGPFLFLRTTSWNLRMFGLTLSKVGPSYLTNSTLWAGESSCSEYSLLGGLDFVGREKCE